jgi:hypothetical protein
LLSESCQLSEVSERCFLKVGDLLKVARAFFWKLQSIESARFCGTHHPSIITFPLFLRRHHHDGFVVIATRRNGFTSTSICGFRVMTVFAGCARKSTGCLGVRATTMMINDGVTH